MKKQSYFFDFSMLSFDRAQVCELISVFTLHLISSKYNFINIGLYRGDGLAFSKKIRQPTI